MPYFAREISPDIVRTKKSELRLYCDLCYILQERHLKTLYEQKNRNWYVKSVMCCHILQERYLQTLYEQRNRNWDYTAISIIFCRRDISRHCTNKEIGTEIILQSPLYFAGEISPDIVRTKKSELRLYCDLHYILQERYLQTLYEQRNRNWDYTAISIIFCRRDISRHCTNKEIGTEIILRSPNAASSLCEDGGNRENTSRHRGNVLFVGISEITSF